MKDIPFLKVILWGSAALTLFAFFQKDRLPPPGEVLPQLYRDPAQKETALKPFARTRGGIVYTITPLYEYELNGMVVSYADAGHWADYYHDRWKDRLNVRDVGVVWGENIKNGVYRRVAFSSNAWTLNWKAGDWDDYNQVHNSKLSNNHLLAGDDRINRQILAARKGDQIYFKGYLAQYAHNEGRPFSRGTSTSRTDIGNGACETVFVTEFKILKRANRGWHTFFYVCLAVFVVSLTGAVAGFVRRGMTPQTFEEAGQT